MGVIAAHLNTLRSHSGGDSAVSLFPFFLEPQSPPARHWRLLTVEQI